MRKDLFAVLILTGVFCLLPGCLSAIYHTGRMVENAGVKHETEGFADVSFERAWRASQKVFQREGKIIVADPDDGKIDAEILRAKVQLRLDAIAPDCVRIRIRAEAFDRTETEELVDRLYNKVLAEIK